MKVKIRTGTRSNIRPKMAENFWVMKMRPSLVPGVKNSRLRNGLEFDWAY